MFFANAGKTSVTCNFKAVHTEFREDQPLEIHHIDVWDWIGDGRTQTEEMTG